MKDMKNPKRINLQPAYTLLPELSGVCREAVLHLNAMADNVAVAARRFRSLVGKGSKPQ